MTYLSVLILFTLCSLPKATNERLTCSKPTVHECTQVIHWTGKNTEIRGKMRELSSHRRCCDVTPFGLVTLPMFRRSVDPPHSGSNSQTRLLVLTAPQVGETSLLGNLDNILPLDEAWSHSRHGFSRSKISEYIKISKIVEFQRREERGKI